jgi:hypothetical protein
LALQNFTLSYDIFTKIYNSSAIHRDYFLPDGGFGGVNRYGKLENITS